MNELGDALFSGQGATVVEDVLEKIMDYTASHFAAEEKLMERHGFPGLAEHRVKHQQLTRKVLSFAKRIQSRKRRRSLSLMLFLQSWLKEHILGTDKRTAPIAMPRGTLLLGERSTVAPML